MIQHLIDSALGPLQIKDEETQHNQPKVTDGRIGHEFLDVSLHHGDYSPIDNTYDRQRDHHRSRCQSGRWEQRNRKAQKPIGAEFQKNSREDNRTGSGRLHMRIRQPGMERKERNFYGEGKRESEKKPDLLMKGQRQVIELE